MFSVSSFNNGPKVTHALRRSEAAWYAAQLPAEAPRVLIVEDEAVIALDVAGDLSAWGYRVVGIANTLDRAMALAKKTRPDLAIVDVSLASAESGFSVAKSLVKEYDTAIIFLTAHSDSGTREQITKARPIGYLFKPYSGIALCNLLDLSTRN